MLIKPTPRGGLIGTVAIYNSEISCVFILRTQALYLYDTSLDLLRLVDSSVDFLVSWFTLTLSVVRTVLHHERDTVYILTII